MGLWDGYALSLAVVASVSYYAASLLEGVQDEESTSGLREEAPLPRMAVAAMLRSSEPSMIRDGSRFFVISKTRRRVARPSPSGLPDDLADMPDDRPRYHSLDQGPHAVFQEDEVELRLTRDPGPGGAVQAGLMLDVEDVNGDEVVRFEAPGPEDEEGYVDGVARLIQHADDYATERTARGRLNLPLFGYEQVDGGEWAAEAALRAISRAVHRVRPLNVIPTVHVGEHLDWDVLRPNVTGFTTASFIPPPHVGLLRSPQSGGSGGTGGSNPVARFAGDVLREGLPAACNAACAAALAKLHASNIALRAATGAAALALDRGVGADVVAEPVAMTLDRESNVMYSAAPRTDGQALYVVQQMNLIGDVDNVTFVTAVADLGSRPYDTGPVVEALRRINVHSKFVNGS
jgi:hypothetical protein